LLVWPAGELPRSEVVGLEDYEAALTCTNFLEARIALEERSLATFLPDFLTLGSAAGAADMRGRSETAAQPARKTPIAARSAAARRFAPGEVARTISLAIAEGNPNLRPRAAPVKQRRSRPEAGNCLPARFVVYTLLQ
jgi:hypothetical protein